MTKRVGLRLGLDARLLAYNQGGISRYITALGHALADLPTLEPFDELVAIYHRKDDNRALEGSGWRGVNVWTPPHHRLERWSLGLELASADLALLHNPDHVPAGAGSARSVVTIHDLAFILYPDTHSRASKLYYSQISRAVEEADRIVAVSESTKQDLLHELGADPTRVRVVHEAAPAKWLRLDGAKARSELATAPFAKPYFLSVQASIEPRKNIPRLIQAFAQVRRAHSDVRLVVVGGPGADDSSVQATILEHELATAVDFPGPLSDACLQASYRDSLALVYPSLYEGFGLPVLEAMAVGAPVIASGVSSLPEVAGNAALLVDPLDLDALAGAMSSVVGDEGLRADLIARGNKRVRQFTWKRAAEKTLAVYREALE